MKLFLPKRSSALMLVDLSDLSPRYLLVSGDSGETKLLAKGVLQPIGESDSTEATTTAQRIREAVTAADIECNRVCVLLARPAIETVTGSLPPVEPDEMPEMVQSLVAQESDATGNHVIDFLVTSDANAKPTDVLAFACPESELQTLESEFKSVGFNLESVTYNGLGAVQLLSEVAHQKLPMAVAITSTAAKTEIAVLHHSRPMLFRTIQRGLEPNESYASALAAELERTLAFIGAGDDNAAQIYLIGSKDQLNLVARSLSDSLSSSVSIAGVCDRVDHQAVDPFVDAPNFANLIGVASAIQQEKLSIDFLNPRLAPAKPSVVRKIAFWGAIAAAVIGVLGYSGWKERGEQLLAIDKKKAALTKYSKRAVKTQQLDDIVNAVETWQRTDIAWLDELKDLSIRFPQRSETLVHRMTLSSTSSGKGVINLSVQVASPEVASQLEAAIRDERHSISKQRVTEVNDRDDLKWSFESRIEFRPLPRPPLKLPELVEAQSENVSDSVRSADAQPTTLGATQ